MNANRKHRGKVVERSATPKRIAQTETSDTPDLIGVGDSQPQTETAARAAVAIVPERRWAIVCTASKLRNRLRERFERLAAHAAKVELRTKYEHRFEAVDAWLDLLQEARYAPEWRISLLLMASAEHSLELKLRALVAKSSGDELYAIDDCAGTPSTVESPDLESTCGAAAPNRSADRRAMVDAYIKEVSEKTGKRSVERISGEWQVTSPERNSSGGNLTFTRSKAGSPTPALTSDSCGFSLKSRA
jgi:hypothetical protein